jgi:hypothetical protein
LGRKLTKIPFSGMKKFKELFNKSLKFKIKKLLLKLSFLEEAFYYFIKAQI